MAIRTSLILALVLGTVPAVYAEGPRGGGPRGGGGGRPSWSRSRRSSSPYRRSTSGYPTTNKVAAPTITHTPQAPRYSPGSPTASIVSVGPTYVGGGWGGGAFYPAFIGFGIAPVIGYAAYPSSGVAISNVYTPSPVVQTGGGAPPPEGAPPMPAMPTSDMINAGPPPDGPGAALPMPGDPVQMFQLGNVAIVQVIGSVRLQDMETAVLVTSDGRSFLTHFDPGAPGALDFARSQFATVWLTPTSDGSYRLYDIKQLGAGRPAGPPPDPNPVPTPGQPPAPYPELIYPPPAPGP